MDLEQQLYEAVKRRDESAVRWLLAAGARADQADGYGSVLLHMACQLGHLEVVRLLVEAAPGAASMAGIAGQTALHSVNFSEMPEATVEAITRLLLAAGARTDPACDRGLVPLHRASQFGRPTVVRLLVEADPATALAVSNSGQTPLHLAAFHCMDEPGSGEIEVIKLLLTSAPAAATMLNKSKQAPIHMAACSRYPEAVQLLVEAAPDLAFEPDANGCTPLHLALDAGLLPERSITAEQVMETARCLLKAAPALQPSLDTLQKFGHGSAIFYADLAARFPLSQEQWQSIPAPCPDLARALPAVQQRLAAEAGWLVGRLSQVQRARLKAAALSLARVQQQLGLPSLPAELSGRILALCLSGPEPQEAEQEWIEEQLEIWEEKQRAEEEEMLAEEEENGSETGDEDWDDE